MIKIGLTGGIATGKSTVLKIFEEENIKTINTDQIAKEITKKGREGYKEVVRAFGEDILLENGEIDRKKLAKIVFSEESKRKKLESILHPLIVKRMKEMLKDIERKQPCEPVVIEIPLLFEVGLDKEMDITLVVYIPEKLQIERLMKRDGLKKEEAIKRLKSQLSIEEKRKRAHIVIDNSESIENTKKQVKTFIKELRNGRWSQTKSS